MDHLMRNEATYADWIEGARTVLPASGFGNFDPGIIVREGRGARVWDEDGGEYVDCLIGAGPLILGHGHPEVLEAVEQQLKKGTTFFANNSSGIEVTEDDLSLTLNAVSHAARHVIDV